MDVASSDDEAVGWFFENALDIFLVCTGGLIEQANPAWAAFSGWTLEETQVMAEHHWWSAHALRATEETVWPEALVEMLAQAGVFSAER